MKKMLIIFATITLSFSNIFANNKEYYVFPDLLFKIDCLKWTEEEFKSDLDSRKQRGGVNLNTINLYDYNIEKKFMCLLNENDDLIQTFDWYSYTNQRIDLYEINSNIRKSLFIGRPIYNGNNIDSFIGFTFKNWNIIQSENLTVNKLNCKIFQSKYTYKKTSYLLNGSEYLASTDSITNYNQTAVFYKKPYLYIITLSAEKDEFKQLKADLLTILNNVELVTPKQIDTKLMLPLKQNVESFESLKDNIYSQYKSYIHDVLQNKSDSFIYNQIALRQFAKDVFEQIYNDKIYEKEVTLKDTIIETIDNRFSMLEDSNLIISSTLIDSTLSEYNKIPDKEFNPFREKSFKPNIHDLLDHYDSIPFIDVLKYLNENDSILLDILKDDYIENIQLDDIDDKIDELEDEEEKINIDETSFRPQYIQKGKEFAFVKDDLKLPTSDFSFSNFYASEQKLIKGDFTLNDYFSFLTSYNHPKNNIFTDIFLFAKEDYKFKWFVEEFVLQKLNATLPDDVKLSSLEYLNYEKPINKNEAITVFWFIADVDSKDTTNLDAVLVTIVKKNDNYQISTNKINYYNNKYYCTPQTYLEFPENTQAQYVSLYKKYKEENYIALRNNLKSGWFHIDNLADVTGKYDVVYKNCSFKQTGCGDDATNEIVKGSEVKKVEKENDILLKLSSLKAEKNADIKTLAIEYYKFCDSITNSINNRITKHDFKFYLEFRFFIDSIENVVDKLNIQRFTTYNKLKNQWNLLDDMYSYIKKFEKKDKKQKVLFTSDLVFDDLNGDGNLEIINMAVSDGQLIEYSIYTNDKKNIIKYDHPNKEIQLKNTTFYKDFIVFSQQKESKYSASFTPTVKEFVK